MENLIFKKEVSETTFQPCIVVSYPPLGNNNEIRFNLELEQDMRAHPGHLGDPTPIPLFLVREDENVLTYIRYVEIALGCIPQDTTAFVVPKELMSLRSEDDAEHNAFVSMMTSGSIPDSPEVRHIIDDVIQYGKENKKIMMPWVVAAATSIFIKEGLSVEESYNRIGQ